VRRIERQTDLPEDAMTKTLDWKAAVWAGIGAGIVFLILEMMLVQVFEPMSMWAPPRMIAAMAMGTDVLPPPDTFSAPVLAVATLIHFPLSIIYAFIFGWIVSRWDMGLASAATAGAVFGLLIYIINFYGFTAIFPWFADARGWIGILSHALYGLALGLVYEPLERRHEERPAHPA
jgi:uncharacterized membrane protein YagU involved in acid resistance